jgi:acyl carrier protein
LTIFSLRDILSGIQSKEIAMAVPTQTELEQMLAESTGVNASDITLDSRFEDLGLDSSDQAAFASKVQQRYGLHLHPDDLGKMTTVGDFYQHVVSKSS